MILPDPKTTPKILLDLFEFLSSNNLISEEKINGEGRAASLIDESNIIDFMRSDSKWSEHLIEMECRTFGDFHLLDYDGETIHVINIKTTKGTTDNAFSKLGFLWAFTDMTMEELPGSIGIERWEKMMRTRKCNIPNRDYWYLVFDKTDMSRLFLRGSKQIVNWKHNPTNKLQISWKLEWETEIKEYSFETSFNNIYMGTKKCFFKKWKTSPKNWMIEFNDEII